MYNGMTLPPKLSPSLIARLNRLPSIGGFAGQAHYLKHFSDYASRCQSAWEAGVFYGVSTTAILTGLCASPSEDKSLTCVDLQRTGDVDEIARIATDYDIEFIYQQVPSVQAAIDKPDLVFLDTWHEALTLKAELEHTAPHARKYILLHDTDLNGWKGDPDEQGIGLWCAVGEFLALNHKEWEVGMHEANWPGLTALHRKGVGE